MVPEAGYPLELIPPVPLPRRPSADLLRVPGRLRGAMKAASRCSTGSQPDVVVGFGGYVSVPAYLAARKRRLPAGRPRGQRPARASPTSSAPGSPRHVATSFPDTDAAARALHRAADPPDDQHPRPGRAAGRGAGRLRARPRPPDPAGHRGLAGRAPAQRVGRRGGACLRGGRGAGAAHRRAEERGQRRRRLRAVRRTSCCRSSTGWTSPTPRPTPSSAGPGATRSPRCRASGLPAVFVPLPIGNGEQALNARPVVDAGGGLLVADAALTPEWVRGTVPDLLTDTARLATMSAAAANADPARRRRASSPT